MITQIHVEPADHDTDLCELMKKYGSDKCGRHDYSRYYCAMFRPIRAQVTRVFELGIFQGASLRAWRDYFPNAIVYGADIDPGLVAAASGEALILAYQCDETSEIGVASMWARIDEQQDIIIDDALHTLTDNVRFFEWSKHMLRSGGLYIIEDIPAEDLPAAAAWTLASCDLGWAAHLLVIPRVVNGEDVPDNNLLVMRAP